MLTFPGSAGHHELAGLPDIVVIVFNHRDIEFFVESRNDGLDVTPLGFE